MGTIVNQLAPVTNQIAASVLNSLWQGAAMTLIAWLILRTFKRLNAATRHVIWCGLLVSVGALTCIGVVNGVQPQPFVPSAPYPIPRVDSDLSILAATQVAVVKTPEAPSGAEMQTRRAFEKAQPARNYFPIPSGLRVFKVSGRWSVFFIAGWALVTAFLLGRLVISFVHLKKLKRTAAPFDEARHGRFQALLKAAGIHRSIRLCSSGQVTVPVALGLSDPLILIPKELSNQLEESELDQVVLHEAAHLARRDDWSNLVQRVFVAALFFHPAVHWITRRLCLEREIACDDWVTSVTGNAKPYALCLTKLAELTDLRPSQALASGAWTSRTQLSRRIIMLLNRKLNRTKRVSAAASIVGITGLCGLVFVFSQTRQIIAAENSKAQNGAAKAGTASSHVSDLPTLQSDLQLQEALHALQRIANPAEIGGAGGGGGQGVIFDIPRASVAGGAQNVYGGSIATTKQALSLFGRQSTRTASPPLTEEERRKAAQLREQVIAALLETLKHETNSELRWLAVNSLVDLEPGRLIEPLAEIVLKDPNPQMRRNALISLAGQPGKASHEALLKLYEQLEEVEFKTLILHHLGSRHANNLGADDFTSTKQWIAKLQQIAKESSASDLKAEAIRQLGRIGKELQDSSAEN